MSGVYIRRGVLVAGFPDVRVDVIQVPGWELEYQVEAGLFGTDEQVQQVVQLFAAGMSKGITAGRRQLQTELKALLGLALENTDK